MRQVTTGAVVFVLCALAYQVHAQNYPPLDTYNPANPVLPPVVQTQDNHKHEGESMDKTALVIVPQAFTTPVLDGTLSPGEWTGSLTLTGLVRWFGSSATVYMKNDACYLYVGVDLTNAYFYGTMNSTMINLWFDVNRNGQWDGTNDGNLALPAPGGLYPPNVASFGYNTLPGWTTSSTGRLRYHRAWATMGVIPSSSVVEVIHTDVGNKTYIEAKIDYKNGPIKLTGGVPFNMRFQTYSGAYDPPFGSVAIQTHWPTVDFSADYSGPTPGSMTDVQLTNVLAAGNYFDISDARVADNPAFGSKAYVTGDDITLEIDYTLNDPPPQTIDYRARFYGPYPSTSLVHTHSGSVVVNNMAGTASVDIPVTVPIGFYTVEVEADDPEICGIEPRTETSNILILGPGQIPCSVFPGDVNNDGMVNYGDKKDLWGYIHDANLNPNWLQGYYRLPPNYPDALAEVEYIGQAAIPWNTADGCYMDTDGNGVVNTLDYVAIKVNWFQTHSGNNPKDNGQFNAAAFDMAQNYPNPFNPSTQLDYSVPEASHVTLTVTDVLGRNVATLINRTVEPGVHTATFDAEGLASGQYLATVRIVGEESGLTFTKSIKMVMNK